MEDQIELGLMMSVMQVGAIEEAIQFWSRLGLEVRFRCPEEGETKAAGIGHNSLQLLLKPAADPDVIAPQSVYVVTNGVEELHARYSTVEPERTGRVSVREYGMRDFSVIDPWGHRVVLGEEARGG